MTPLPTLRTARLVLRPFTVDDAPAVQVLADDARIARGTIAIPHPYPPGAALAWIGQHEEAAATLRELVFAITHARDGRLLGVTSLLALSPANARAEIGYWIAVPEWSRGYATEAIGALMDWGTQALGLTRFVARVLAWNAASAAVLRKAGFHDEGRLVAHEIRDGEAVDMLLFGRVVPGR